MAKADTTTARPSKAPSRHTRRNFLVSALGRRKIGRAQRDAILARKQNEYDGISGTYNTPIALKVWDDGDPNRDADMALVEECAWEIVGERLCVIFNISDPQDMEQARSAYIRELEDTLRWEVQQAEQDIKTVDKYSRHFDDSKFQRMLHSHRRTIAAYHQTVDLLKQGKQAYMAAMKDSVLIFEGHSFGGKPGFTGSFFVG
ncbi:uncharacterized protein STEHIDRAFT_112003 [Stereum hirsutum FP-91666 SS1]|uniref:uncharacterized protein n=1 Tax=Stereum hirsutum (strain FP-91666) TaxID=721885 RepID=UPI000444A038|nr:uncharacterized protein STEHIDRAFT_112003 [Stereum hirsutum FP-91666 SS1]EIM85418.1 hypothetical protein STEHIDRAFT_112003 [Stereum hirsutum FP-91666 SS1]